MNKLWTAIAVLGASCIGYEMGRRDGKKEGCERTLKAMELYLKGMVAGMDHNQNNDNDDEEAEEESQ